MKRRFREVRVGEPDEARAVRMAARLEQERALVAKVRDLVDKLEKRDPGTEPDPAAREELAKVRAELAGIQGDSALVYPLVDEGAVTQVVAGWTGIPIGKMVRNELETVLGLKDRLAVRVVGRVCRDLVPRLTYRVAPADSADPAGEELVLLASALHEQQERLARLFASDEVGPVWVGATSPAPARTRPGILADVFTQLVESQNLVAWTPAGRAAEVAVARRTRLGYAAVGLAAAATAGLAVVAAR